MDTEVWNRTAAATRASLLSWMPSDLDQRQLRADAVARLQESGGAFLRKAAAPEHITASCFVFTPDHRQVLLAHHRKAGRWLQLGGHIESEDADPSASAKREAMEEAGIPTVELHSEHPVDIDVHRLHGSFGSCRTHWDLGYLGTASESEPLHISGESNDVAWWPLADLPMTQPHLAARVSRILRDTVSDTAR